MMSQNANEVHSDEEHMVQEEEEVLNCSQEVAHAWRGNS